MHLNIFNHVRLIWNGEVGDGSVNYLQAERPVELFQVRPCVLLVLLRLGQDEHRVQVEVHTFLSELTGTVLHSMYVCTHVRDK